MWRWVIGGTVGVLLLGCWMYERVAVLPSPALSIQSLQRKGNIPFSNEHTLSGKQSAEMHAAFYLALPDDNVEKYVGKGVPLSDMQYVPVNLVELERSQTLHIQGERLLRKEAYEQLVQLSLAFYEQFQQPLMVISAYRSYQYQKQQIAESCKVSGYCAREGESEHQLGLAVDLREATNEATFLAQYQQYYDWLMANAHLYGFHQSYQKGKATDGYAIEPWHWRYLGKELAKQLWEQQMTFSEWVFGTGSKQWE
ncbi:MAG: M15 family metallopeptidase [Candidatus Peribacteria bacterium]|jgi:D-alanyl-D-alanine carboxypeptidase|nr:M15 family metallopeptidase [Candidatus Peribacteria bacterium]